MSELLYLDRWCLSWFSHPSHQRLTNSSLLSVIGLSVPVWILNVSAIDWLQHHGLFVFSRFSLSRGSPLRGLSNGSSSLIKVFLVLEMYFAWHYLYPCTLLHGISTLCHFLSTFILKCVDMVRPCHLCPNKVFIHIFTANHFDRFFPPILLFLRSWLLIVFLNCLRWYTKTREKYIKTETLNIPICRQREGEWNEHGRAAKKSSEDQPVLSFQHFQMCNGTSKTTQAAVIRHVHRQCVLLHRSWLSQPCIQKWHTYFIFYF